MFVRVGIIVNTHGLKGELKLKSTTDFKEERFKLGSILFIDKDIEVTVNKHREYKGLDYLLFENLNHINDVEKYKGKELFAKVKEGETNYFFQYLGMKVYDQENNLVGEVTDVWDNPAHVILVVNEKHFIPCIDVFVKKEDFVKKEIYVHLIEGMI